MSLIDIQNTKDTRGLAIQKVGVRGIRYPIKILDRQRGSQQTVAKISMYVDLAHDLRGTHMSRFVEVLNQYREQITIHNTDPLLDDLL